MNLLEKAKSIPAEKKKEHPLSNIPREEVILLAQAYLNGEVTMKQCAEAVGVSVGSASGTFSHHFIANLRKCIENGTIEPIKIKFK